MESLFTRNLKRVYPVVKRAAGSWIDDAEGRRFLDGCSGAVAANLGHGLSSINEAISRQLHSVAFAHTSQFISEPAMELAARLIKLAPANFAAGRVYFASGGSEAVETSLKLARTYFYERDRATAKQLTIARWNSYHGSTFGAMALTGHPARRKPYLPLLKDQPHINAAYPYRCPCGFKPGACPSDTCAEQRANELETAILHFGPENVMAFIGEPVVGAALGAVAPRIGYWRRIREICTKYDVLLIADEVMTGLGRCGANFALDLWEVSADIIVVGKGLAAGYMPLAAVIASEKVIEPLLSPQSSGAFEHGFTYSGHPASCAAGNAVLDYMSEHKTISEVGRRADQFRSFMQNTYAHELVGDVRVTGFLGGIEFVKNRDSKEPFAADVLLHRKVAQAAFAAGLLVYPGAAFVDGTRGDHIIVAPPLNITDDDMEELFVRLNQALNVVATEVNVGSPV